VVLDLAPLRHYTSGRFSGGDGPSRRTVIERFAVPRIKSAKKRMRQAKARTARNKAQRSQLRTAIKKVRASGSKAEAAQALSEASRLLDRAGRKNLVHRRNAARQKSRLAKAAAAKS